MNQEKKLNKQTTPKFQYLNVNLPVFLGMIFKIFKNLGSENLKLENIFRQTLHYSEAYSESCQTSKMKRFAKMLYPLMPGGNKKLTHT